MDKELNEEMENIIKDWKIKTKSQYKEMCNFIIEQFDRLKDANIIIDINNIGKPFAGGMRYLSNDGIDIFNIDIYQNMSKFIKIENAEFSFINARRYLESLDIKINNDSLFIIVLMHELGHIDRYLSLKRFKVSIQQLKNLEFIAAKNFENIRGKKSMAYRRYYSESEQHAERFCYEFFPGIWKALKENNYIK